MGKKFRVTQYHEDGRFSHDGTYPFYWIAAIVAWVMAGPNPGNTERYYCVIREVDE